MTPNLLQWLDMKCFDLPNLINWPGVSPLLVISQPIVFFTNVLQMQAVY